MPIISSFPANTGGVKSFNGRTGDVLPAAGDYTIQVQLTMTAQGETFNESSFSADKTFTDLFAAYQSGLLVTAKYNDIVLAMASATEGESMYFSAHADSCYYTAKINADNSVIMNMYVVTMSTEEEHGIAEVFGPVTVTAPASDWTGDGPWTQTVSVPGVTAEMDHINIYPVDVVDNAARKAYKKAYGCLAAEADTVAGGISLTCRDGRPETDIQIIVKGVR